MAYWSAQSSAADVAALQADVTTLEADVAALEAAPKPILFWGTQNVGVGADTRFVEPGWETAVSSTTITRALIAPSAGTCRNMRVHHNAAAGDGDPVVYTLFVNGSTTDLSVSLVTGAIGSAANTSDSVAVAAGDRIEVRASKAADITDGGVNVSITVELHP